MGVRKLETFARMVFHVNDPRSIGRLRRSINAGELPGGHRKDGTYFVDTDAFERAYYPHRATTLDPKPVRVKQRRHRELTPAELAEIEKFYPPDPSRKLKVSAAHSRKRKRVIRQATPAWADRNAIAAFYRNARRKTQRTGELHCVDHIIPLQGKLVCGLHVETNLRVITSRANSVKHNRHE